VTPAHVFALFLIVVDTSSRKRRKEACVCCVDQPMLFHQARYTKGASIGWLIDPPSIITLCRIQFCGSSALGRRLELEMAAAFLPAFLVSLA